MAQAELPRHPPWMQPFLQTLPRPELDEHRLLEMAIRAFVYGTIGATPVGTLRMWRWSVCNDMLRLRLVRDEEDMEAVYNRLLDEIDAAATLATLMVAAMGGA